MEEYINKRIKYILIIFVSVLLLSIFINFALYFIEENIESNTYHVWVYNITNDNVNIIINNKNIITIEGKTFLMDKILDYKKNNIYNYRLEINGQIILEKEIKKHSKECSTFSAAGGFITNIIIKKLDDKKYNVIFTTLDNEINIEEELKYIKKKKFTDIFNRDGLN